MRQAKQQSQELSRAGDFVNALLGTEPGQELPKPPADILPAPPVVNGISPQKAELMPPFSLPPAPPPQLPLPQKPDLVRSAASESNVSKSFQRSDTEKPPALNGFSPSKLDSPSSQISSLLNALATVRMEADSQGNRVKQLEEQLKQERKARESAEERARHLLDRSKMMFDATSPTRDDAISINSDSSQVTTIECPEDPDGEYSNAATSNIAEMQKDTEKIDSSAARLQVRLDLMLREMEEVKAQMEYHKRRADDAEEERLGLADMVERIRNGEPKAKVRDSPLKKRRSSEPAIQAESAPTANGSAHPADRSRSKDQHEDLGDANGVVERSKAQTRQLQDAISTALTLSNDDRLIQSAPYASILGVVLIGVGIMTYLNGWQKIDR